MGQVEGGGPDRLGPCSLETSHEADKSHKPRGEGDLWDLESHKGGPLPQHVRSHSSRVGSEITTSIGQGGSLKLLCFEAVRSSLAWPSDERRQESAKSRHRSDSHFTFEDHHRVLPLQPQTPTPTTASGMFLVRSLG